RKADEARTSHLFRLDREDEGPMGPPHLLDRRRLGDVDRGGRDRRIGGAGRLHLRHAAAPRRDVPGASRRRVHVVESPVGRQYGGARARLLDELRAKGVRDMSVLRALDLTPRHLFVPTGIRHRAYEDTPLPIGSSQTISQPSVHARYLETLALKGTERVLEIGTGSGYQPGLLAHLGAQVFSVERIKALLDNAREAIKLCEVSNV